MIRALLSLLLFVAVATLVKVAAATHDRHLLPIIVVLATLALANLISAARTRSRRGP